jgi:TRAP-type C4-dicarboxylate transport system substrate-binding protein
MKKSLWIVILIAICFIFTSSFTVSAKPITLTVSTQNPETGWGQVAALKPWLEHIEKASMGKVKFKVYYSQTLNKGPDAWKAVKDGIADIGWCFHAYWRGMTDLSDVISLPLLPFKNSEEASATLWKLYEKFPQIREQYKDNHILLLYTTQPYFLITTKKQVKSLEDIKGMKIRMMGGPSTEMMKLLGGVPISVPMPGNYMAMQKGVTDGMGAPWEAIESFRLYEVVKYYTTGTSFPVMYFSIAVNKRKWASLPDDVKAAFNGASGLMGARFWGRNFFDTAKEPMLAKAKKEGYEVILYHLPEAEQARWRKVAGKPVWDKWLAKMKNEGHPEAEEILDYLLSMYDMKR